MHSTVEKTVMSSGGLDKLEGEITCGICQEHYVEPKVLPCLHYYCKECIVKLAARSGEKKPFSCPECRSESLLPEGGVNSLKTAFFVNRLKTTITTMERAQGKVEVHCELCSRGGKAASFCRQCAMFICESCTQQHEIMKIFVSHEVALLKDLKHGRAQPIYTKELPNSVKCKDHEEPVIIYCFDCEVFICHHCTVKDHRDCNFEFCKKAASVAKRELTDKLQPLKEQTLLLCEAIDEVKMAKEKCEVQGQEISHTIESSFKRLREILDKRERELLTKASQLVQDTVDKLNVHVQEKNLSSSNAEIQSVIDCTQQCVEHCSDTEVMSMLTEIQHRMEHELEQWKQQTVIAPVEVPNIAVGVECEDALLEFVQAKAIVSDVLMIDASKCTLTMNNGTPEVGVKNEVILTLRDGNSLILTISRELSCVVTSLYDNSSTICDVSRGSSGVYTFPYTPTVRGRHTVALNVENSFPFFVIVSPNSLDKPVKVWKVPAFGLTANPAGEILVASGNDIDKLTGKGKSLQVKHRFFSLRKIDVDKEGNIYGICGSSNYHLKMLKCDPQGAHVDYYKLEHVIGGMRGLAVVDDQVLVSSTQTGIVTVYDTHLNYIKEIQYNMGMILAISSDNNALYFADYTYSCIHVFSRDGTFLYTFGGTNLKEPCGLCVSSEYVYVCGDYESHSVVIFTTKGHYVNLFTVSTYPRSICVDSDGFLYVGCDSEVLCY